MVIDLTLPGAVTPFRVLVVSDRSICRGPAAQRLLAAHLRAGGWDGDVVVGAAGVGARAGDALHPDTARALTELDVDAGGHVARRLTERRVVQADLLLAVAQRQVRDVAALRPEAARRTFGLRELLRLSSALTDGSTGTFTERVAALDAARRSGGDVAGDPDAAELDELARLADRDLDDLDEGDVLGALDGPAGAGYADHRRMVRTLDGLTLQVARVLTAGVPGGGQDAAGADGTSAPDGRTAGASTAV